MLTEAEIANGVADIWQIVQAESFDILSVQRTLQIAMHAIRVNKYPNDVKKRIVIEVMKRGINEFIEDETIRTTLIALVPNLIDTYVYIANNAKDMFKLEKHCACLFLPTM